VDEALMARDGAARFQELRRLISSTLLISVKARGIAMADPAHAIEHPLRLGNTYKGTPS
jgi:hypothetical protein